jgi:tRNA G18 (ribose-2'-O)-methylase SpoU
MPLPVSVLLHNVRSLYNVGAFFRTADAVGVSSLHLSGFTGAPPSRQIAKTALGSEQHVRWERSDPMALIDERRAADGKCRRETVEARPSVQWQPKFPVLLIFGHEVEGRRPRSWAGATPTCVSRWSGPNAR